jgi:crossover junction endodeoxyribonuclease RusA
MPRKLTRSRASVLALATGAAKPTRAKPRHLEAAVQYVSVGDVVAMYLTVPEPPSANRYWRIYRGRAVVSAEAVEYKRVVRDKARAVGHRCFGPDVRVKVMLDWHRQRKSGDLDNRIKVALDALRGVLYADDKQVIEIHAKRFDDRVDVTNPRGTLWMGVEAVP